MKEYAVIGNPISHSKSPVIHKNFAEQTHQEMEYGKIEAPLDGFVTTVVDFKNQGGKGLNITVPFKQAAFQYVDELSSKAKMAKAINTILFKEDGSSYGENTDGSGLLRDITVNHGYNLKGKNILILGAGGAVRGILMPLLELNPKKIIIVNRTVEKAIDLSLCFSRFGNLKGCGYSDITDQKFDFIINATSASLNNTLPPLSQDILSKESWCYDLSYSDHDTPFITWAKSLGVTKAVDGIGMLIEQAADSFLLWRGIRPDTKHIKKILRPINSIK